ncbi:hypothetical protein VOLCADRAFT_117305 [Volvox carteri f. nagariensis]|uniref:Uncharacterized protein n=1 Tax=Volvox carteri f. nagariensis TaxID=3068 RepID=D8TTB1_VOLCA|nr:uncharacterized protein VOLCADRAFT_117305 [Volvox carteri f. nagariensis]EFJ49276.1 hypothetical protein VOLCADRAFT_117305 [Volvox carteri f. nagariensis]|eukprot:XP_002949724.1 hypothetical protein VOLCADRAFT_117305 [Volvox carteri f. nagariensis]
MPEIDENQLMWLEEDVDEEEPRQERRSLQTAQLGEANANGEREHSAAISALEDELQRTRKELMDVRRELAAKTVQLSRKEVIVSQEKVAELAANVASEKDKQLASLAAHVEQLEVALGQKEEELEESRRLYNAQKRALREALATAAEAEAAERQADEARARTAVAQVVEDELDRLQHELALLQARYDLEMRARDAELQSLRTELQAANTSRKQAIAAAEAALTEAWQAELGRATEDATARVAQLEAEVARVRQQLEEQARGSDTMDLAGELASLNQQKVAIQREFDAFREMATTAAREHREAAARLLEENAALKSRLAARAFQDVQAGLRPQSKVFSARTGSPGSPLGPGPGTSGGGTGLLGSGGGWVDQLPELLAHLERQRKGLAPMLVLGGVVLLFLLVAVVRAAVATRAEHSGGLCFLAHLGINVGPGCGPKHPHSVADAAGEELVHLIDQAPRVHDVEAVAEAATGEAASDGAGSAASVEGVAATQSADTKRAVEVTEGAAGAESLERRAVEEAAADSSTATAMASDAARQENGGSGSGSAKLLDSAVQDVLLHQNPRVAGAASTAVAGLAEGGGAGDVAANIGAVTAGTGQGEEEGAAAAARRRLHHHQQQHSIGVKKGEEEKGQKENLGTVRRHSQRMLRSGLAVATRDRHLGAR